MPSLDTRDAVKHYELRHNVLLQSILPGGLLSSLELKGRCEAFLVPRQVSLEVLHIAPYFVATAQRLSTESSAKAAPPLSALFGGEDDAAERGGSPQQGTDATNDGRRTGGVTFPPENADAFRAALARFLEYHLLHFDGFGNSEFTNLSGQRGSFAEDLDHVKRFGHFGQVAVLADADALRPRGCGASADGTAAAAGDLPCHPSSLQIFIIDKPLMDSDEVRLVRETLYKLTVSAVSEIETKMSAPRLTTTLVDIPFLMGGQDAGHVTADMKQSSEQYALSAPSAACVAAANRTDATDTNSCEGSVTETVVIEDFEAEPPEDPDLEAYVAKYTHISERQRQRSESTLSVKETLNSSGAASAEDKVIAAPCLSHSLPSAQGHQVVAVAGVGCPPNVSRAAGTKAATVATTSMHANVLCHEYSRECIKDYRRVVAADNEIFYSEFERLMSLRCAGSLAKVMSEYVSNNQHLQQPIQSSAVYNKFVERCHALLRRTPRLSVDKERMTIMQEGVERYVTSRLYHQLFNVSEDERRKNERMQQKLLRLENMAPADLDALPEVERHHVWGQAMFELDGMDFFKSPREKLRCGMRSCELLSLAVGDILGQRREAKRAEKAAKTAASGNAGGVPLAFGADEFLPCFLLLVLRARPLSFVQNVLYIEKFRCPALMSTEESYCLATLQSSLLFWENYGEDGQMNPACATASTSGSAEVTSHNVGSASMRALTKAPPSLSGIMQPQQPPPHMTENDLLPSVRQASSTGRQQTRVTNISQPGSEAAAVSEGKRMEEEAPTVLDVLFGWANRNLAPLASEIGLGGKAGASDGDGSARQRDSHGTKPASITGSGAVAHLSPPRGTVAAFTSGNGRADVGQDTSVSADVFHTALAPAVSPPHCDSNMSSRTRVRQLLVAQNKTFEQLTLAELQMIVEEARQLLLEGK
ncbi:conserved hypothetical protein [Leishmania major strain Friedlin]|uniref:VPS9 domain-containing protein n=1 Tax=Leishmania major TaxID=5664 RepID=Q4Q0U8_LEIMA|nr:conserved hypothetical protein [Leishmania major strain Friedlin]CAG9584014.1 Vacuolar_sorting_protein_9_(VPS9)_domain_containing_protein_-_putative [Leishmania major strain Friedlin]CAJ09436.1 conserved hypothetical protein [Leishmania major strain Friedlin]|eukprot:XP_001687050.1 conserved hypothetical protein [Leishmania major strain Friedlin]